MRGAHLTVRLARVEAGPFYTQSTTDYAGQNARFLCKSMLKAATVTRKFQLQRVAS